MTPKECILLDKQAVGDEMTVLTIAHSTEGYKAGQYIFLEHNGKRRAYSLASHPDEDGIFRLLIKTVPTGLSEYLTTFWQEQTACTYIGPIGHFTLPDIAAGTPIVFIGAGSGVAPFPALLAEADKRGLGDSVTCLLWAKTASEWADLAQAFPLFTKQNCTPCLTRLSDEEQSLVSENTFLGRTTQKMRQLSLTPQTLVYCCGSLALLQDVQAICAEKGIPRSNIRTEGFVPTK